MKRARSRFGLLLVFGLLTALLPVGALSPASAASAGDIVVNEVMQNPDAVFDSAGEWFELFNPTAGDIDIDGWTISDNDYDTHVIANGGPLVVPAGGFLVLGNNIDAGTNGGVAVGYSYGGSWYLSNSADEVVLLDGSLVEVDRVEYDGGATFPDPTGASMSLNDPADDNNVGGNWCTASTPFGDGDLGTPGADNDCAAPPAPELVVNEVMQNPDAVFDSAGEWFELFNPTAGDIDIDGWTISDNDYDTHVIANGGPLVVPAGGFLVLGNNIDAGTNGGVAVGYSYGGSWYLSNSADEVVLLDGSLVEVDRVEYDGGATFPDPTGASMSLNDPADDNNVGGNWCTASTPFGDGDLGTPGADNDCAAPPAPEPLFTQYVEGGSYNKAIEIANLSGVSIGVDGYVLELYSNGAAAPTSTEVLAGTLVAGDVMVLAHKDAAPEILAVTDVISGTVNWNGDDAVVLRNAVGGVVDSIGQVGFDPGSQWGDAALGTKDNTLCRLDSIVVGDTDPSDVFDPAVEWTALGKDVFHGLGAIGCEPPPPPPATEEKIYDVQGSGLLSPFEGQSVIIEGVVTADHQDGDFKGFFMQEVVGDGIEETSDGIFVYEDGKTVEVSVGDVVKVEGEVDEYYGMTQIKNVVSVSVESTATFAATVVSLPWLDLYQPEWYEGMYVTVPQPLTISEYFNFDRYGEIVLTTERASQPTAVFEPGSIEAAELAMANQLGRITLDDNRTSGNPYPAIHPNGADFSVDNSFRGGDIVENVTGVVNYSFGLYRIQPTQGADYTAANLRDSQSNVGGDITVASFNVLNYFTTLDNAGPICGPGEDKGCRGADDAEEFERQRTKIIAAIAEIDADVVGLIEIENHVATVEDVPLADLVSGLNDVLGAGTYDYVNTGSIGDDAIKVAFIYKPATISPNGAYSILDSSVDPRFNDDKNRPALAQTFTENVTGESVTVVVNHLKSKGSSCGAGDDDPEQGSCNLTRTLAAEALVDWLADPANGFDEDVLVIGDLNSYDKEDPIDAMVAGGYSDLVFDFGGEYAYSYVYSGQWGYLDYAMANESLRSAVTGTTVWHVNSDEPDILDYDLNYNPPEYYEPNAFRSSDHDPVIVGLNLANPMGDKEAVAVELAALVPTGDAKVDRQINKAVDSIEASLNTGWWTSDQTITSKKVFDNERSAVVQLELVVAAGGPEASAAQDAIDVLVNADRQLAQIELIAAIARDGKASKIADAQMAMAYAADLIMDGLYNEAVNAYKTAWDAATKA